MTETFIPPMAPSPGTSKSVEMRTAESAFGDGYTQRSGDGLNTEQRKITAEWKSLTIDQADEIEVFFLRHLGYLAFLWRGPRDGAARRYRCKKWSRDAVASGVDSIRAEIEMVYDL